MQRRYRKWEDEEVFCLCSEGKITNVRFIVLGLAWCFWVKELESIALDVGGFTWLHWVGSGSTPIVAASLRDELTGILLTKL